MRVSAFFLLLSVGNAAAADGTGGRDSPRLDFAISPAFQSAFENRVIWPGAPDSPAAVTSDVPPKVRVALWSSQSEPHYRAEVLRAVPPHEIPAENSPIEQITAKTIRSAWLEEPTPAFHVKTRKRHMRRAPSARTVIEEDEPSFLQSVFGALFAG